MAKASQAKSEVDFEPQELKSKAEIKRVVIIGNFVETILGISFNVAIDIYPNFH